MDGNERLEDDNYYREEVDELDYGAEDNNRMLLQNDDDDEGHLLNELQDDFNQ